VDGTPSLDRSVERATRNELIFRRANEQIEDERRQLEVEGRVPFLCECEEEQCRELIQLTPAEYAEARVTPRHFLLVQGHPFEMGRIVSEHEAFMVVEKTGQAGEIAERGLDG
jgi:hypothetical protein